VRSEPHNTLTFWNKKAGNPIGTLLNIFINEATASSFLHIRPA
jgi:hypothetical protein